MFKKTKKCLMSLAIVLLVMIETASTSYALTVGESRERYHSITFNQNSSTRKLTNDDLDNLTLFQIILVHDEIVARNGGDFTRIPVDLWFNNQKWYEPQGVGTLTEMYYDDDMNYRSPFNEFEEYNLQFIEDYSKTVDESSLPYTAIETSKYQLAKNATDGVEIRVIKDSSGKRYIYFYEYDSTGIINTYSGELCDAESNTYKNILYTALTFNGDKTEAYSVQMVYDGQGVIALKTLYGGANKYKAAKLNGNYYSITQYPDLSNR
ncbi:MAG: hypothetical protein ACRDBO_16450 [Lachnospiraceae bacterium]